MTPFLWIIADLEFTEIILRYLVFAYDRDGTLNFRLPRPNPVVADDIYFGADINCDGDNLIVGEISDHERNNTQAAYIFEMDLPHNTMQLISKLSIPYQFYENIAYNIAVDINGKNAILSSPVEDGSDACQAYGFRFDSTASEWRIDQFYNCGQAKQGNDVAISSSSMMLSNSHYGQVDVYTYNPFPAAAAIIMYLMN